MQQNETQTTELGNNTNGKNLQSQKAQTQNNYGFRDSIKGFEKVVNSLKDDLERYKITTNASPKYIFFKEQQINILNSVLQNFIDCIDEFNVDSNLFIKKCSDLESRIFKLEGICILHGIANIRYFMSMSDNSIINLVTTSIKEEWRQLPIELQTFKKTEPKFSTAPTVVFTELLIKAKQR